MKSDLSALGFLLMFILAFAFLFNGCGNMPSDHFEYAQSKFEAEVVGLVDDTEISATVKSNPQSDDGDYTMTVCFNSPKSLDGIVLSVSNGEVTARLDDICVNDPLYSEMIIPFSTLCYQKDIFSVEKLSDEKIVVKVQNENCELEYFFDSQTKLPISVCGTSHGREISLDIISFSTK